MITGILRTIGLAAVCVMITILSYEGLRLPFIGQIIPGIIASRLEGYVTIAEKTAADAKAAEQKRQADAAKSALEAAKARTTIAEKLKDDADAELEKRIAADAGGGCGWTPDDTNKLRHR